MRYIHVTGHTSDKAAIMKELRGGYTGTYFLDSTMRQFGGTVLVPHLRNIGTRAGRSSPPGEAMHTWVQRGDRWLLMGRQSTRLESF